MGPALPGRDRLLGDDCADGHARTEPLGSKQHVRLNPSVLGGKHLPRAPDAALDFVTHQQDPVPVTEIPQRLEVVGRWNDVATFAEDRFHEQRCDIARVDVPVEQVILDRRHAEELT